MSIFDRDYEEVGSLDKGLILKTAGKIKILWGKKFIDLLDSDGNINVKVKSLIQEEQSKEDIKLDGFYLIDGNLVAKFGDLVLELTSKTDVSFVSFLVEQAASSSEKYTALQNIGFLYKNLEDVNVYPTNGIIYVEESLTLFIIKDGVLSKYYASIPNPYTELFVIAKEDASEGALVILGEGSQNSLKFDSLKIYSNYNLAVLEANTGFLFNLSNMKVATINLSGLSVDRVLSIGASDLTGYRLYKSGNSSTLEVGNIQAREDIETNRVHSPNSTNTYGFDLYQDDNESYLKVDNVEARKEVKTDKVYSSDSTNGFILELITENNVISSSLIANLIKARTEVESDSVHSSNFSNNSGYSLEESVGGSLLTVDNIIAREDVQTESIHSNNADSDTGYRIYENNNNEFVLDIDKINERIIDEYYDDELYSKRYTITKFDIGTNNVDIEVNIKDNGIENNSIVEIPVRVVSNNSEEIVRFRLTLSELDLKFYFIDNSNLTLSCSSNNNLLTLGNVTYTFLEDSVEKAFLRRSLYITKDSIYKIKFDFKNPEISLLSGTSENIHFKLNNNGLYSDNNKFIGAEFHPIIEYEDVGGLLEELPLNASNFPKYSLDLYNRIPLDIDEKTILPIGKIKELLYNPIEDVRGAKTNSLGYGYPNSYTYKIDCDSFYPGKIYLFAVPNRNLDLSYNVKLKFRILVSGNIPLYSEDFYLIYKQDGTTPATVADLNDSALLTYKDGIVKIYNSSSVTSSLLEIIENVAQQIEYINSNLHMSEWDIQGWNDVKEIILGQDSGEDTQHIIDKWNELVAFLDGISDDDLSTLLGLLSAKADKASTVSDISYTSNKFTKTINGTTTDIVSASTLVSDGGGIKSISIGGTALTVSNNSVNLPAYPTLVSLMTSSSIGSSTKPIYWNGSAWVETNLANLMGSQKGNSTTPIYWSGTEWVNCNSIPSALSQLSDDSTHRLVTDTEKSTWNSKGTYSKPSGGIPKTDLDSSVLTSLGKADTALLSYTETDPIFTASAAYGITSSNISSWNSKGTYSKPSGGIPKTDLASAVQTSLGKADTALLSYTESDPIFTASAAYGITSTDITNWNNKTSNSGTVTSITIKATSPIAIDSSSAITTSGTRTLSHANSGVTAGTYRSVTVNATGHVTAGSNPTTLSGYGITDAKIANGVITLGSNTITPLTSFTETDPVFSASAAAGISSSDITNWNGKTSNTGTVTSVATGVGLTGGSITTSGTIKAKLKNETANTVDSARSTSTDGGLYSVEVDKSGYLAVRVPWKNTTYTVNNATYTIKTKVDSTTTSVSDFTANQSSADDVTFILGTNITLTPDTTNRTITIAATDTNTDTKVTLDLTNSSSTNLRPILVGYTSHSSDISNFADTTNQVYAIHNIYVKPSTGSLYATNFIGNADRLDYCYVTGAGASGGWWKIATCKMTSTAVDTAGLTLFFTSLYYKGSGIIEVDFRKEANASTYNTSLTILRLLSRDSSINPEHFKLVITSTSTTNIVADLYYYLNATWGHKRFTKLDEGSFSAKTTNRWTLISTSGAGGSLPTESSTVKIIDCVDESYAANIPNISASKITSGTLPIARGGTGATSALDAITNLGGLSISEKGILVPANSTIGNYKTPGRYYVTGSEVTTTLTDKTSLPITDSGFLLTVSLGYRAATLYLYVTGTGSTGIYRRYSDNTGSSWSSWQKFAFTSDLSDYLLLSGGTLTGDLTMSNAKCLYWKDTGGTARNAFILSNSSNNLYVGYGTSAAGYNTYIEGNNIYFRYGTGHTTGITLASGGDVTIEKNLTVSGTGGVSATGFTVPNTTGASSKFLLANGGVDSYGRDWYMKRGAVYTSGVSGTRWMKVASLELSTAFNTSHYSEIILIAHDYVSQKQVGILALSYGREGSATSPRTPYIYAKWIVKTADIDITRFVLAYDFTYTSTTATSKAYLYVKMTGTWQQYYFAKLSEAGWNVNANLWVLNTGDTTSAYNYTTIPETNQIVSTDISYAATAGNVPGKPFQFTGTCTSAADAQAKEATVGSSFELVDGVIVAIKFTNTNTFAATAADVITLNVNNTGAKQIWYAASKATTGASTSIYGYANRYTTYMYDATNDVWVWLAHGADDNSYAYLRVYRQTSGYNADYPLLVSRTATIGTAGTNASYSAVYGVVYDSNLPTLNPSTGLIKVHALLVDNEIKLKSGSYTATIEAPSSISSNITYTLPSSSGTLATISDLTNYCVTLLTFKAIGLTSPRNSLNYYTTAGNYALVADVDASSITNKATANQKAFTLTVSRYYRGNGSDTGVRQIYREADSFEVYERYSTNSGSSWTEWKKVLQGLSDNDF